MSDRTRNHGAVPKCIPVSAGLGAALAFASALIANLAGAQDVVYLNDGGEVRGAVMSRDPAAGVVVRLADGTTRTIAQPDVSYVGRPNTGGLYIDGAEPGRVTVQDEVHGRTPFEMNNLPAGTYRVTVEFDGGGTADTELVLKVGRIARAKLALPESRKLPPATWLLGGGVALGYTGEFAHVRFGPVAGMLSHIAPFVELRFTLSASLLIVDGEVGGELSITPAFHFIINEWYGMELGLRAAALTVGGAEIYLSSNYEYSTTTELDGALGIYGSFASFRFGPQRNLELTLWHALYYLTDEEEGAFETGLAFAYLLM